MQDRRRTWFRVGAFALASTSLSTFPVAGVLSAPFGVTVATPSGAPIAPFERARGSVPLRLAQGGEAGAGGEGGEGGEAGEVPESYALPSSDPDAYRYDARAEIANYAAGVHASYVAAHAAARTLEAAIDAFLADPTAETLAAARKAWVTARPPYLVTETFRFYDGPIEAIEGRINAWPMNEAFIDYVEGKPDFGIINDPKVALSISEIDDRDQVTDEADVTTGWHAIEFLLWGQDLNPDGPGARPASDYLAGKANNDRRRTYLHLVTQQLVDDLGELVEEWAPGDESNYAAEFAKLPEREAIGRILNGMAVLAGSELMSERLAVGLDSGDQEDEHSCFSDTTHQDFVYDVKGIETVWNGVYPGVTGPGVKALVEKVDPDLARDVDALLADATAKVAVLGDPWDKVLASPEGSRGRVAGEAAVTSLQNLGDGLKGAGTRLGVLVQIPTSD